MSAAAKVIGARLRKAREDPPWWSRGDLARLLRGAATPGELPQIAHVKDLIDMIKQWENGRWAPGPRYRPLYCRVLGRSEHELFSTEAMPETDSHPLPLLLANPVPEGAQIELGEPLTVARVEALLDRLYRLDAEFGGNELCHVIGTQVAAASSLFRARTTVATENRLLSAVGGLTQIAGWLSIDANQHANANRYLSAAIYAGHEIDDLGLAAHAMGYMSLHAFYRDQPKKALALASTASSLATSEATPRTRATLHNRAARAYARLGEATACDRQLDLARTEYERGYHDETDPQWLSYVTDVEIAAQRGACLLDLGRPNEAVEALTETIALAEATTPDHVRDLAHYKTRLASAHLLQNEPAQAAEVAAEAHDLATRIGSARISERFNELIAQMRPVDVPEVRALVDRVKGG